MTEQIAQRAYDSILRNGGITVNLQGHEPSEGYAYSPYPELERVLPAQGLRPEHVHQYVQDNQAALSMPGNYLGAWHDQQSGNVFLDVSHVGPAHPDTVAEAKKQNQIAVTDLSNFNEIPTGLQRSRDVTSAVDHQTVLDANAGRDLSGLPGAVNVPGHGPVQFHSHGDIQRLAEEYNRANGLGAHPSDYSRVDPQTSARIAQEYERMPHNPHDPQVAQAYDALARETRAQYDHAVRNGYNFEFYPEHDPYPNSPREAVLDLHHNKHMYVYPTETGYGQAGEDPQDHPLLGDSGVRWNGKPVTHNDLFRAVHDFYGHAKEGLGFRADGEDNAYRQHAAMFSEPARRALTSETRGQNSWVNFGPYGEHNQTATSDTIYAPQKAGLMPDWTMGENRRTAAWDDAFKQSSWSGWKVIEGQRAVDDTAFPEITRDMDWYQRRPFLALGDGRVLLGQPGTHHRDLGEEFGINHYMGDANSPMVRGQVSPEDGATVSYTGREPSPHVINGLINALEDHTGWRYNDPYEDRDAWENRFSSWPVTNVHSERPSPFKSQDRPFLFTHEHTYLGDPGAEHYDVAKGLGLDLSAYEDANFIGRPSKSHDEFRAGIYNPERGVYAYPRVNELAPDDSHLPQVAQHLTQHLGVPVHVKDDSKLWEQFSKVTQMDHGHSYTREDSSRPKLTNWDAGNLPHVSWEMPQGVGIAGPVELAEHALNNPPQNRSLMTCPNCHAFTKMPLGVCPHCGFAQDEWSERWSAAAPYAIQTHPTTSRAGGETPFIVDHPSRTIHMGQPGGGHAEIARNLPGDYPSIDYANAGYISNGRVNFFGNNRHIWHGTVTNAINWHQPVTLGEPYNPELEDGWDAFAKASGFEEYADPNCKACYGQGSFMADDGAEYPCYKCVHGKVPAVSDLRVHQPTIKPVGWNNRFLIPDTDLRWSNIPKA